MKQNKKIKKEIIFVILIILFIISAITLFFLANKTKALETLSYTEKSNIDYLVCLKENNFYTEKCQPKGMGYIASAIDNIDVVFDYNFTSTSIVNYTYEYYINGIITIYDRNDSSNVLFTKIVNLVDVKTKEENNSQKYNINERLNINYPEYNDLIKSFKSKYNISAYSSLKLKLYIKTTISYENFVEPMQTSDEMELTIPLTENTININMNYKEIDTKDKFVQVARENITNKIYFGLSVLFIGLSVGFIILLYITVNKKEKSKYEKFINDKLKNLDRIIISAKESVKIKESNYKEIIDVKDFNELVDVAERLIDVIVWVEITNPKETVSWFTIVDGKRLYQIIYKSTDKEFK